MFSRIQKPFKHLISVLCKKLKAGIRSKYTAIVALLVAFSFINSTYISSSVYKFAYNVYGEVILWCGEIYQSSLLKLCINLNNCEEKISSERNLLIAEKTRLFNENTLLRKKLKLVDGNNYKYVTAFVTQTIYPKGERALVISAGVKDGLQIGNLVISEYGVVGRISEVSQNFSITSLLGSSSVKIAAIILPSNEQCIVGSSVASHLSISYLDDITKIKEGSQVITSGKDSLTPYGTEVGKTILHNNKIYLDFDKRALDPLIVKVVIQIDL